MTRGGGEQRYPSFQPGGQVGGGEATAHRHQVGHGRERPAVLQPGAEIDAAQRFERHEAALLVDGDDVRDTNTSGGQPSVTVDEVGRRRRPNDLDVRLASRPGRMHDGSPAWPEGPHLEVELVGGHAEQRRHRAGYDGVGETRERRVVRVAPHADTEIVGLDGDGAGWRAGRGRRRDERLGRRPAATPRHGGGVRHDELVPGLVEHLVRDAAKRGVPPRR